MDGLGFGSVCYRSTAELAVAACSSINGVTSAGVVSCTSPAVTGTVLSYTLKTEGATTSTRAVTVDLQPCEPYDLEWWSPILAAFFLALVVILSARMVYTKVFNRETGL